MSLKEEDRRIIVNFELEKAERTFAEKDVLIAGKLWSNLANRLYYALFHAVSAMLIHDHREVGTHKGAVIRFRQYYVNTGIFTPEEGAFYSRMQSMREESDYNCYYDVTESEILMTIEPARKLIDKIKQYIKSE
ncbi:MAG: HEPN domain-containing protein [Bacteroidaceae bacterium]|nr:HEPN domain-containing protein [Bacteroidaceae bacterium]